MGCKADENLELLRAIVKLFAEISKLQHGVSGRPVTICLSLFVIPNQHIVVSDLKAHIPAQKLTLKLTDNVIVGLARVYDGTLTDKKLHVISMFPEDPLGPYHTSMLEW
jgi:hypothetical protein